MQKTSTLVVALSVALGLVFSAPTEAAPETAKKTTIVMGFNPAESAETVELNGKKLAEYFKKTAGVDVKTFIASDYTALIEALRSGQIDLAWLPAFSYVKAEEIAKAEVLFKCVRKGHSTLWSAIITRADKPYKTIEDLKGKNIAWVDPSSSTGHIIPKSELILKKKIDPDKFFAKQVFAGAHDAVVLAVVNGTVDAGATFSNDAEGHEGAWSRFLKGDDLKKVRIIYMSSPIPGDTVTSSKNFASKHGDLLALSKKTLLDMSKTAEGKDVLYKLYQVDSLEPATAKEYAPLRDAAKTLNLN